jgi:opacity protein-like surface antigen
MKKIIPIFLALLVPFFAAAEPKGEIGKPERDLYFGLYAILPTVRMTMEGPSLPSEVRVSGLGASFDFGKVYSDGISVDFSMASKMFDIATDTQANFMRNLTFTIGSAWGRELFGSIRVYMGAGIGPSVWINRIDALAESYAKKETAVDFTYLVKFGAAYILSDRFDLDFTLKLQNLGKSQSKGPEFNVIGDVTQTEFRLGLIYKFGI